MTREELIKECVNILEPAIYENCEKYHIGNKAIDKVIEFVLSQSQPIDLGKIKPDCHFQDESGQWIWAYSQRMIKEIGRLAPLPIPSGTTDCNTTLVIQSQQIELKRSCPICDKESVLLADKTLFYKCNDCGEEFTTTPIDTLNLDLIKSRQINLDEVLDKLSDIIIDSYQDGSYTPSIIIHDFIEYLKEQLSLNMGQVELTEKEIRIKGIPQNLRNENQ